MSFHLSHMSARIDQQAAPIITEPEPNNEPEMTQLEPRPFRPFKSSEEYLEAMKEDLAEWLNGLYPTLELNSDNFCARLETGVALCRHANAVRRRALDYYRQERSPAPGAPPVPSRDVLFRDGVQAGTFPARDNVSNFIGWCRALGVLECLLFETDDLVLRKNEKSFILCLLEVARRGAQVGMPAPLLVQLEQEIDRDIAEENARRRGGRNSLNGDGFDRRSSEIEEEDEENAEYERDRHHHHHHHHHHLHHIPLPVGPPPPPPPQIITNDLKSLDEMVRDLLNRCTCPLQFPMIRVAEGKYRIGDTKTLIYVRILRSHVMVRVGGGWDTLEHYLDKHDPCRCRQNHRPTLGAKLTFKQPSPGAPTSHMEVTYHRTGQNTLPPNSAPGGLVRQRSSSPPRQRRASTSSSSSSHTQPASSGSLNSLLGGDNLASNGGPSTDSSSDEGYRGGCAPTPRARPPPPRPVCLSDIQDGVRRQGRVHRTAGCAGLGMMSAQRDSALGDDEDDDDDDDLPDSSPDAVGPPPPSIPAPPPPTITKPVPKKSRIPCFEASTVTSSSNHSSGRRQRRLSAEVANAASSSRGCPTPRMPRSRSHSNDAGNGCWSDSPLGVFARQQAARRSLRPTPTPAASRVTLRRATPPTTISADALDFLRVTPSGGGGLSSNGRSQSASPRRPQPRAAGLVAGRSLQASPTKPLAPLLQRLVDTADLDSDRKVLDHIRDLLQSYELDDGGVNGAASPDSGSDMGLDRSNGRSPRMTNGKVLSGSSTTLKSKPVTSTAGGTASRIPTSRIPVPTSYHSLPS